MTYLIEHPTRGVFVYWDGAPRFSYTKPRTEAQQFERLGQTERMLERMLPRISRDCYILRSPARYGEPYERVSPTTTQGAP